MNKIKLLYDVVTTMKEKEVFSGVVKVEGKKDEIDIFNLQNEFKKNLTTGETKAKISMKLDYNGNKMKHDSSIESNEEKMDKDIFHGHMRYHCHNVHHDFMKLGGMKEKMNKFAAFLNMLNKLEVEEQKDKTVMLKLSLEEMPKDMRRFIQESSKISHGKIEEHPKHEMMKSFFEMNKSEVNLNILVNQNREIDKIILTAVGTKKDKVDEIYGMSLNAEVNFTV